MGESSQMQFSSAETHTFLQFQCLRLLMISADRGAIGGLLPVRTVSQPLQIKALTRYNSNARSAAFIKVIKLDVCSCITLGVCVADNLLGRTVVSPAGNSRGQGVL
jgi:hypothetical protein